MHGILLQDSLLVNPELLPQNIDSWLVWEEMAIQGEFWLFFLFVFQLGLFGWLRLYFPNRIELLLNAFISNRFVSQLTREERTSSALYNLLLEVEYFLSLSTFIYLINHQYALLQTPTSGLLLFLFVLFALVFLSLIKSLLIHLLVWLFDMESSSADILFYRFLSHVVLGFGLLVLCILWSYATIPHQILLYTGISLFSLSYAYRLLRSALKFWNTHIYGLKYIILYICALEILPLCIAAKYLFNVL